MFQRKDGEPHDADSAAPEERAYEDNWYRSLKALSEQREEQAVETVWESEETQARSAEAQEPRADALEPPAEAQEPRADALEPPAEASTAGEAPTSAAVDPETPPVRQDAAEASVTPATQSPARASDRQRFASEEFEARAGQLLERLRSLQNLGDRPPAEPEPVTDP